MFAPLKAARCRRTPKPSRTRDDAVPEAAHFQKSPAKTEKILIAEYQQLITLFVLVARPLQQEERDHDYGPSQYEKKVFESSKHTNCFSI